MIPSDENVIQVTALSKRYEIYDRPSDRLKQFLFSKLARLLGKVTPEYFREFWALKDVSLELKRGQTIGLIGKNGSGKSTLLQIICGTLTPTHGEVRVVGRIAALLELGSGFNPEFTGIENIYLNATILGLTRNEIDARLSDILKFADIGEFVNQPVKTYSSGMVLRLAFAVIAHVDADILIIDEALAVGDAFFSQKCMTFIRKFIGHGTVLFVSHDLAAVKSLCTSAIWLDKGTFHEVGSPKEVCDKFLQAQYENNTGHSLQLNSPQEKKIEASKPLFAEQVIHSIALQNQIKIFTFSDDSSSFGKGGAKLEHVGVTNSTGQSLQWVIGGEVVCLLISCKVLTKLSNPILGFFLRDRLGQTLFGDNTYLSHQHDSLAVDVGDVIQARFKFQMPILPLGDYSVTAAIADGNPDHHDQHHWVHDALFIRSESTSISTGLIGIPMLNVELDVLAAKENR